MYDETHNLILQYFIFIRVQVVFFEHGTYIKCLLLNLSINSYKVRIILLHTG